MTAVLVVAVAHPLLVEVDLTLSGVDGVGREHASFHARHEAGQFESGSRFHCRADGVVEVFPIFDGVVAYLVPGQVGNGANEPCGHLRNDDGPPSGVVASKLLFKGVGGHVLEVEVEGGDDVHAFHWVDEVVVCDGHPLVAGDFSGKLLALDTGQFLVPGALNAHALVLAVDANGACCELAKRPPPVLSAFEDKPALVPSQLDKGEVTQFLVVGEWNVASDQCASVPTGFGVVEFALDVRGTLAHGGRKRDAQRVDLRVVHVPTHAFALGVPAQVVHRYAGGEQAAVAGDNLSPCGFDGAHARGEFLSAARPGVVLHGLDHEDAPKDHQSNDRQPDKYEPNASCVGRSAHSSAGNRMGGAVGCSRPSSAVDLASRLCWS